MAGRGKRSGKTDFFHQRGSSGEKPPESVATPDPLEEILRGQCELLGSMEGLKKEMHDLKETVGGLDTRVKSMETKIAATDTQLTALTLQVSRYDKDMAAIQTKVKHHEDFVPIAADNIVAAEARIERLEDAARAHVLCIVGMPREVAETHLLGVVQGIVQDLIQDENPDCSMVVRQARRIQSGKRKGGESEVGSTVLVTLADAMQRDILLRRAAMKKNVYYKTSRLLLFPDVSPTTQIRRKRLSEIRKELVTLGLRASIWQPAKLRVVHDEKVFLFNTVVAAENFLSTHKESLPNNMSPNIDSSTCGTCSSL